MNQFRALAKLGVPLTTAVTVLLFAVGVSFYEGFWSYFGLSQADVPVPFFALITPSVWSCVFFYNALFVYVCERHYSLREANGTQESPEPSRPERGVNVLLGLWTLGIVILNVYAWNTLGLFTLFGGGAAGFLLAKCTRAVTPEPRFAAVILALILACLHAGYVGKARAPTSGHPVLVTIRGSEAAGKRFLKVFENNAGILVVERLELEGEYADVVKFIAGEEIATVTYQGAFKRTPK